MGINKMRINLTRNLKADFIAKHISKGIWRPVDVTTVLKVQTSVEKVKI